VPPKVIYNPLYNFVIISSYRFVQEAEASAKKGERKNENNRIVISSINDFSRDGAAANSDCARSSGACGDK